MCGGSSPTSTFYGQNDLRFEDGGKRIGAEASRTYLRQSKASDPAGSVAVSKCLVGQYCHFRCWYLILNENFALQNGRKWIEMTRLLTQSHFCIGRQSKTVQCVAYIGHSSTIRNFSTSSSRWTVDLFSVSDWVHAPSCFFLHRTWNAVVEGGWGCRK